MSEEEVGIVTHYFDKIGVGAVEITVGQLAVGDTIHIMGHTTDLTTTIAAMQIEHDAVETAKKGDTVGIKVAEHVRQHDKVFKVVE